MSTMQPSVLSRVAVAARDALMKYAEQWEHIASPGHVLLARVRAYAHKSKAAFIMLSAAFVTAFLSQWLPQRVGDIVGVPVGKIAGLFESKPEMPTVAQAPKLKPVLPKAPTTIQDASALPSSDVIAGALKAAGELIKDGSPIKGCDTSAKVTDAWATQDSFAPHCRYSADKSRTWVWGVMGTNGSFAPFMSLVRKDGSGNVAIYNVAGATMPVGQYQSLDLSLVPRAVAADFPELVAEGQQ